MARAGRHPGRTGPPTAIDLPALAPFASRRLEPDGEYEALAIDDAYLAGQAAVGAAFRECRVVRCNLDDLALARSTWWTCLLEEVHAGMIDAADSTWREVIVDGGRIGALSAPGATWTDVRIRGGKLDLLGLAGARLRDVVIEGCLVGELDLAGAEVRDLAIEGGGVDVLDVGEARLTRLDLRRTRLGAVRGIGGLRGAVLAPDQVLELAPQLADHLGIRVEAG